MLSYCIGLGRIKVDIFFPVLRFPVPSLPLPCPMPSSLDIFSRCLLNLILKIYLDLPNTTFIFLEKHLSVEIQRHG